MLHKQDSQNPMQATQVMQRTNEESLLNYVRISGLSIVFNSRATRGLRITWAVVLTVATVLMLAQIYISFTHYLSNPISVQLITGINKTIPFPRLTVCNQNTWNMTAMEKLKVRKAKDEFHTNTSLWNSWHLHDYIGVSGYTVEELWDYLGPKIEENIVSCWFGGKRLCKDVGEWKRVYTLLGTCSTFQLNTEVTNEAGPANNLRIILKDPLVRKVHGKSGFRILLHWPNEPPTLHVATHGSFVYINTTRHIRMSVKLFRSINIPERPCSKVQDYSHINCSYHCFRKTLLQNSTCRLPSISDENGRIPLCNSSKSYSDVADLINMIFYSHWSMDMCNCSHACNLLVLEKNIQVAPLGDGQAELIIYYNDLTYQAFTDTFSYTTTFLLSDIGGALGLMLGASLLSFIQIGEIGILQIRQCVKNRRKRN